MSPLRKLTICVCLIAMLGTSGSSDAGLFHRKRKCRPCCPPPCYTPAPCRYVPGDICPKYPAQPGSGTILWYAVKCPTTSVGWYGSSAHGPGECNPLNSPSYNCDTSQLTLRNNGNFFVCKDVAAAGINKGQELLETDFGGAEVTIKKFKSKTMWIKHKSTDPQAQIFVQIVEVDMEHSGNRCTVKFGIEINPGNSGDVRPKGSHNGKTLIVRDGSDDIIVITDTTTVPD